MGRGRVVSVARSASCAIVAALFLAWGCGGDEEGGNGRGGRNPGTGGFGATAGTGAGTGTGGGGGLNAGNGRAGTSGGFAGTGMLPSGGSGGLQPGMCASATVTTSKATPTILFVIDGSGSMCASFGGGTRWQALRSALLDPMNGLVYRLQSQVVFGAMLYDGTIDLFAGIGGGGSPGPQCAGMYFEQKQTGDCPLLIQVAPALDNATALDAAFPAVELGGSTPTDKAMRVAVDQMLAMRQSNPDVAANPLYIILATDGQPNDICVGSMATDANAPKRNVIAEVDRAAAGGITTFVISLAGNDQELQQHLEEVADHGEPMNPNAHTFSPETPEELTNTLAALIGGAIGCEITLNGMVTIGQECRGKVEFNGTRLPCCEESNGSWQCDGMPVADPNGWRLKDPKTVELLGSQCVAFLEAPEAVLDAGFPCDIFVPE